MSFFRPEIKSLLGRWAETLVMAGAALVIFAVALRGWAVRPLVVTAVLCLLGAVALVLAWIAGQKARMRGDTADPGVVQVDEARVIYLGPTGGGIAHLTVISRVLTILRPNGPAWIIEQPDEPRVIIPAAAKGTESLIEAFAALPGFRIDRAARALTGAGTDESVIWERGGG